MCVMMCCTLSCCEQMFIYFFFFFIVQHTPTHAHARLTRTRARTHINREPWVVPENMLNPDSKARGPDWLV